MRHWFTRADLKLAQSTIKRFDPAHWTIDFPRGAMGCVVSTPNEDTLCAYLTFGRRGDLVGLIFESEDRHAHPGHRRETSRDYSHCQLRFRWQSTGLIALDSVHGPTLTIEGRDHEGVARSWYVRLWNYAEGQNQDAVIALDFDALDAGFNLLTDAERVYVRDIDRMFISLVPPSYQPGSSDLLATPLEASVQLSGIECSGSGSMLDANDAFAPEHHYRICTAYDDLYHLTPERVIDAIERLGYRRCINHYVGMSHYPALTGSGLVDPDRPLCEPARRWHESFAALAAERGYHIIWSISFELLEPFCPEAWKQRAWDGTPGRTGYTPPSNLLSPANSEAMAYLARVATAFARIGADAGMPVHLQMGEPWWWINSDQAICIYDDAARARQVAHEEIRDVRGVKSDDQVAALTRAGEMLSAATASIVADVRRAVGPVTTYVLPYLPSILRKDATALEHANLPAGWAAPAFDVLQLEDYEWVVEDLVEQSRSGLRHAAIKLGYDKSKCRYLAGFVMWPENRHEWGPIMRAARRAERESASEVFIWALPQVLRDGLTIFAEEEDSVDAFLDTDFPLEIGSAAWVEPCFSTTVHLSAAGTENRNANHAQARLRIDAGPGVRSLEDLQKLLSFFRSVRGNAIAFRFRDALDFSSANMTDDPGAGDVLLEIADGKRRRFPLVKRYGAGEVRRITRPVQGSILVAANGVQTSAWTLSESGIIEFDEPPASGARVTAGFLFDVPVRFEEQQLRVSRKTYLAGEAVSVPLIEVREA